MKRLLILSVVLSGLAFGQVKAPMPNSLQIEWEATTEVDGGGLPINWVPQPVQTDDLLTYTPTVFDRHFFRVRLVTPGGIASDWVQEEVQLTPSNPVLDVVHADSDSIQIQVQSMDPPLVEMMMRPPTFPARRAHAK